MTAPPLRTLTTAEARAFYDRFGHRQDWSAIYEDPAVHALIAHGDFERSRRLCELGCGTGRLAAHLLGERLPAEATYLGLEVSSTMATLARRRLAPFGPRARVELTDGAMHLPVSDGSCDRVLSSYVLDLLAEPAIDTFLDEAHRVLAPGGRLCLTSLTFGRGPLSRALAGAWMAVHRRRPALVGGCRPLALRPRLDDGRWELHHHEIRCTLGLCSEVLVASPRRVT